MIVDQFSRPFGAIKAPDRNPLPVAPVLDSYRDYVAQGLTPEMLAAIFKEADAGNVFRQAELFEQILERDGHVLGEKGKRERVILDAKFSVIPAGKKPEDAKIAEFVDGVLKGMTDWEDSLEALQTAVGRGFSSLEIFWDASSGQAWPERLEFLPQRRFTFLDPKSLVSNTPLLITDEVPQGVSIPSFRTIFHKYGGKSGHPTRSGVLRVCAWMYLFKNYSIKDWVVFAEVYGMPVRLGKYDPSASASDKDALYRAVRAIGTDAAGVISKTTDIEFVESKSGTASGDLYKSLASFCNVEMSKALVGAALSESGDGAGSLARDKVLDEVRKDLVRADARAIASTVRNQLIRPLVGFNFGWDKPVPGYKAEVREPEDLVEKSIWLKNVMERVAVPKSFVYQGFGIPDRKDDEEMVGGPMQATEPPAAPAAAKLVVAKNDPAGGQSTEPDTADRYTERLSAEASDLMSAFLAPVARIIEEAQSLEEIEQKLLDAYPAMSPADLGVLIGQAMAAAELAGRFEAGLPGEA